MRTAKKPYFWKLFWSLRVWVNHILIETIDIMVIPASLQTAEGVLLRWQDALVSWVKGDNPDLTNRQMAVLLIVSLDESQHTIRGLASRLGIAKPAVTRAIDRLSELDYVARVADKRDRRNVFVVPTSAGRSFLVAFVRNLEA
jgi:DNA-binding MarR family transcriptional regulator